MCTLLVWLNSLEGHKFNLAEELFLNSSFYAENNPVFIKIKNQNPFRFQTLNSILNLVSLSDYGDNHLKGESLVKHVAKLNAKDKTWAPFLCVLGLSFALKFAVRCIYQENGIDHSRFSCIYDIEICEPGLKNIKDPLNIFFCSSRNILRFSTEKEKQPKVSCNHFVPLLPHGAKSKRAAKAEKVKKGKDSKEFTSLSQTQKRPMLTIAVGDTLPAAKKSKLSDDLTIDIKSGSEKPKMPSKKIKAVSNNIYSYLKNHQYSQSQKKGTSSSTITSSTSISKGEPSSQFQSTSSLSSPELLSSLESEPKKCSSPFQKESLGKKLATSHELPSTTSESSIKSPSLIYTEPLNSQEPPITSTSEDTDSLFQEAEQSPPVLSNDVADYHLLSKNADDNFIDDLLKRVYVPPRRCRVTKKWK